MAARHRASSVEVDTKVVAQLLRRIGRPPDGQRPVLFRQRRGMDARPEPYARSRGAPPRLRELGRRRLRWR